MKKTTEVQNKSLFECLLTGEAFQACNLFAGPPARIKSNQILLRIENTLLSSDEQLTRTKIKKLQFHVCYSG